MTVSGAGKSLEQDKESADNYLRAVEVGEVLRRARVSAGWSLEDMSRMLKITPFQIDAIENERWLELPCSAIVRGFVRNYARLVSVDAAPLMQALDRVDLAPTADLSIDKGTPVKLDFHSHAPKKEWAKVVFALVFLAGAVCLYLFAPADLGEQLTAFMHAQQRSDEKVPQETVADRPEITAPQPSVVAPAPMAAEGVNSESATQPESSSGAAQREPNAADVSAVSAPTSVTQSAVAAGAEGVLQFSFDQASWVEVRDGKGAVVFSQLNPAGRQQVVKGVGPFSLVIGNARHVSLNYNGKVVDLASRVKDDVARLTIE